MYLPSFVEFSVFSTFTFTPVVMTRLRPYCADKSKRIFKIKSDPPISEVTIIVCLTTPGILKSNDDLSDNTSTSDSVFAAKAIFVHVMISNTSNV